ncbi:MAG: flippase-like domain-containing protein [Anaerolineales bacterium]|nr:flippase-like domain-containing protein [Anaerolineales bacterium]
MNNKKMISALQAIVSICLLMILFSRIDVESFLNLLRGIRPGYFSLGVLCYFLSMVVMSFRWLFIVRTANEPVEILQLITINFVGSFFSMFLPTAAGGDVARIYESSRRGMVGTKAVSTVLLDRVIGLISLVVISIAALMAGYRYTGESALIYLVLGVASAFVVAWRLFFNPAFMSRWKGVFRLPLLARTEPSVRKLYQSLYDLQLRRGLLLSTLAISIFAQIIEISSAIFLARALGIDAQDFYFFIFIPLIWLITMAPISLNGLGVREGAFAFFFGQIGVLSTVSVSLSLLSYACRLFAGLLGGILFLMSSIEDTFRKWVKGGKDSLKNHE